MVVTGVIFVCAVALMAGWHRDRVASALNGLRQGFHRRRFGIEVDGGLAGREIDGRHAHSGGLAEGLLDPRCTRGAAHALDQEVNVLDFWLDCRFHCYQR